MGPDDDGDGVEERRPAGLDNAGVKRYLSRQHLDMSDSISPHGSAGDKSKLGTFKGVRAPRRRRRAPRATATARARTARARGRRFLSFSRLADRARARRPGLRADAAEHPRHHPVPATAVDHGAGGDRPGARRRAAGVNAQSSPWVFCTGDSGRAFDGSARSAFVTSARSRGRRRSERYMTRAAGRVAARWPNSCLVARALVVFAGLLCKEVCI